MAQRKSKPSVASVRLKHGDQRFVRADRHKRLQGGVVRSEQDAPGD
jgi:hypothetical protein